jgi:adenosylcobyric acid synthase
LSGALLIAGTHSDAGKSVVVAGICRRLAREGVRVAPFKAQNMALNSFVTREGAEIGRAQAAQAAAANVEPEAAMNPVLLKPSAERTTQVVVRGKAWATASARSYGGMKKRLMPVVLESLAELRSRFDVVVCEGAGSPAEINLRENDLANMGLARAADLPVLLVGDIDRGGLFASLYGTLALLSPEDQAHIAGFLVNKFRGDPAVLAPGLDRMTSLTGRPFLGTLPWIPGLGLDGEDSLALDALRPVKPPLGRDVLTVAVVRLGRISNFTDFDALSHEPGVSVRFTQSAEEILAADLAVLPGTKATVDDLRLLRIRGLDHAFAQRTRRGMPTLGICGGYQMLGERIFDGVESAETEVIGLGLLPVETSFETEKVLGRPQGKAPGFGDTDVSGYEIHHGRVRRHGCEPLFEVGDDTEGCLRGTILGTSWHGVLESDGFRRALLAWVAEERGLDWRPGEESFVAAREAQLERLGDLVADHVDREALLRLVEGGAPRTLPVVAGSLVEHRTPLDQPEIPLAGGRLTEGVVRVGDTVRRPVGAHTPLVHALLRHLEAVGFYGAPRVLGIDERGREILTFIEGEVPPDLRSFSDVQLVEAAALIRRFHDATAGSNLAGDEEVVCHNDLSPCNAVFVHGTPRALIDFDAALPGPRALDLGYALWMWLDLGSFGPDARAQGRRMRLMLDSYGLDGDPIEMVLTSVQAAICRTTGRKEVVRWMESVAAWVEDNRDDLTTYAEPGRVSQT